MTRFARPSLAGWRWPLVAAILVLAAHFPFPGPTLDDIDAVNFALGVKDFDPAAHRPHPPGYPVYVLMGKLSTATLDAMDVAEGVATHDQAALALAGWSILFGALGVLAAYSLFRQLEQLVAKQAGDRSWVPVGAALLAVAAPLFWFTSARPMSDVPGLVAALFAQALLLAAWRQEEAPAHDPTQRAQPSWLPLAALVAALGLGIRSQVLWLTLPLLAAVLAARVRRAGPVAGLPSLGAYAAGVLAWGVPMVIATGGWQRYLSALGSQGAEDFAGVDMLWTHPGPRRLIVGLVQTFVLPWSSVGLAVLVLLLAAIGFLWMLRYARTPLVLLVLLAAPYAIFHTLFQETVTTRYALPLLPVVCYLAVRGADVLARARWAVVRGAGFALPVALVAWSLVIALPALRGYASRPSPVFQAFREMERRSAAAPEAPVLAMHRSSSPAVRWMTAESRRYRPLPAPPGHEWQQVARAIRDDPDATVWFVADPRRTDLALVDRRGVSLIGQYRWAFDTTGLLDGTRPGAVNLYRVRAPGWIALEGWALTPETAGVAALDKVGPAYRPIEMLVRRRPGECVALIGGRHLGSTGDGAARLAIRLDGQVVSELDIPPTPRFFLRMFHLPAGSLSGVGALATLTVHARPADGSSRFIPVAIEQFDLQDADQVVHGYGAGWQEPEYDPVRPLLWRWMSDRATIVVHAGAASQLTLRLAAESPRKYFDRPVSLTVRVGSTELARVVPDEGLPRLLARLTGGSPIELTVPVARAALDAAGGEISLEADNFFVPAGQGQGRDERRLSVRVLGLTVR